MDLFEKSTKFFFLGGGGGGGGGAGGGGGVQQNLKFEIWPLDHYYEANG